MAFVLDGEPFEPAEEPRSSAEHLALIGRDLLMLRRRARAHGSLVLIALIEAALVQAASEAGIGPADASPEGVRAWLSALPDPEADEEPKPLAS